jgi:hypothetical protein
LAEKKLSLEFLRWLDEQFVAFGENWAAFGRAIDVRKSTVSQWKDNQVGKLDDESLEKLMRYMAQLPPGKRIIAASTSEIQAFAQHGIKPGSDMNDSRNWTRNTALNFVARGTVEDAIAIGNACFAAIAAKTQNQGTGSERVRLFILSKLGQADMLGLGAREFSEGFYASEADIARCDRWMRGSEPIPKKSLFTLANALSARLGERISEADLLTIYSDDLVGAD